MVANFLNGILSFIIKFFIWLITLIASLVIYPIQALLVTAFPTLGEYLVTLLNWFTGSVFPYISFIKQVFLEITCLPQPIFTAIVGIFIFRYTVAPALRGIYMLVNTYFLARGQEIWFKIH